jgi:phage tail-like protein
MPPVLRDDPYAAHHFKVTLTGVADDGFLCSEVSGIDAEVAVIDHRGGDEPLSMRQLPGLTKFPHLVFKGGIRGDLSLWNWILEAMSGKVRRTEGSIILMDEAGSEVMRWNVRRAWPTKFTGPGLNAANNEVAIQTLEVAHEGLTTDGQQAV